MEERKASWYSIVRYCSNNLTGEIVNVGIILHSLGENDIIKYHLIDENSPKIRAITGSQVDINTYKTSKETLEYYLKKSVKNSFGSVGDVQIASPADEKFLLGLYEYYNQKKLTITKPKFMFENLDKETKVHLLYRSTDIKSKKDFSSIVNYLANMNNQVFRLDLDDLNKVEHLCNIIRRDAHDVDELMMA